MRSRRSHISPDYYCMDRTVRRRALPGVLEGIARLSQQYDYMLQQLFHAGDRDVHPLILFNANEPGEFARGRAGWENPRTLR
ncbi:FAD-linked oxidase C-terminal domain-containing protein [Shigella flexneri]